MKIERTTVALAVSTALSANLGVSLPVLAQSAPATVETSTTGLQEIIVTARRREESVQDVPISISVFSQELLDERNVTTAADLANYTPSLNVNTRFGPDQASFSIRGFTQELRTTASVGVYFADVVAPRGGGSVTAGDGAGPGAFFDLQNVQVLKGPQGTLFGRNTTGGAVLLVPQKPTDALEGYFEVSSGDYDLQRAQGVVNVPIGERVRSRLGVDYQKRDGFMKNVSGIGPKDTSDLEYIAARASLVWDVTDNVENYTILSYTDSENNGSPSALLACNPNIVNGRRVGLSTFCDAQVAAKPTSFYELESTMENPANTFKQWQAINTTTWMATDNITLKNIVSYADMEQTMRTAVFGTNWFMPAQLPFAGGKPFTFTNSDQVPGIPTNSQTSFVEELQLQGRALDSRLNWQTGLYFENSRPDGDSGSQSMNQISCAERPLTDPATFECQDVLRAATLFGVAAQNPAIAQIPGILDRFGATGSVQRQLGQVEFENKAVYAQATYTITDQFKVTGGARYTWDETTGFAEQTAYRGFHAFAYTPPGALPVPDPQQLAALGLPFVPPPIPLQTIPSTSCINTTASISNNCRIDLSQKSDAPTWLIDFDYTPNDDILLYAKYARGYRQGSLNIFGAQGFQTFEPEKVDAYELGLKTSFDGAVPGTFNLALFYNDLQDQQIQTGFQSSTGSASPTTGILNAGASTIKGVEVDTTLALLRDLRLDLSYTFLDTKLEELEIPPVPPGSIFDIRNPTSVEGDPLPQSPENKVSATLTYHVPVAATVGDLSLGVNYTYTDEQITSANSPFGVLPAYDLLNANVTLREIAGSNFDVSLFLTNALDEEYTVYVPGLYNSVGAEFRQVGPPRMWGARVRYSFGQ